MAKAEDLSDKKPAGKRVKTGGRKPKQSLEEMIIDAEKRGRLAALPDDTTFPAELAAFYLIMSMSQLRELRTDKLPSEEDKQAAKLEKAADAAAKAAGRTRKKVAEPEDNKAKGLRMIKIAETGAIGSNQSVTYKLGDLRNLQAQHSGYSTFEAMLSSAGLRGFVSERLPFFAKLETRSTRSRPMLIGKGWDHADPKWEKRFLDLYAGKSRPVWLTAAEAATSFWTKPSEHRKFAKPFLAELKHQALAVKSAIEGSMISEGMPDEPLGGRRVIHDL